MLRTTQHGFPIVDGAGRLHDVLTLAGLVAGLRQDGSPFPVVKAMSSDIPLIRDHEKLSVALEHLQKAAAPAVGVVDAEDALVGYVMIDNIGELMMLRGAVAYR